MLKFHLVLFFLGLVLVHQATLVLLAQKRAASAAPLIERLSPRLRNLLLKRSLYDVLCDIWFMPKLGTYIKLFLGPIFLNTSREQYQTLLKKADNPALVEKLNRKGLIYFMPSVVQHVMLPFDQPVQPCLRDLLQETKMKSQEQQIDKQKREIACLAG